MLIPILALAGSFWFASQALDNLAARQVEQEAKLVMRAAKAARDYTADEIRPLINSLTSDGSAVESKQAGATKRRKFIKPTVPAYAARRVLDLMLKGDPEFREYEYKEAAIEPTIGSDEANPDEKDLIDEFSHQITSDPAPIFRPMKRRNKDVLSYSQRMVAGEKCMPCHKTKEDAMTPEFIREFGDMVSEYGDTKIGGFGWVQDSVVAAQVVYVPKEKPHEIAKGAIQSIGLVLLVSGLLMVASLWLVVNLLVLRPVARLSERAKHISEGRFTRNELPVTGKDEIAELTAAFNLMNRTVYKLVKDLKKD